MDHKLDDRSTANDVKLVDLTPTASTGADAGKPPPRHRLPDVLTKLAQGSAPFLSIFLVVHLSAPVMAGIGGSGVGSSVMLLGREYYQTVFGERYLLFLPFAVHVGSGIAKRVVLSLSRRAAPAAPADPEQQQQQQRRRTTIVPRPRPLTSLLSLTAYTSLLLFLPVHFLTHRLAPSSLPSLTGGTGITPELDLEFVKVALRDFPVRSWMLYAGLVGCVGLHWVEGVGVLMRGSPALGFGAGANKGEAKPTPTPTRRMTVRTKRMLGAALVIVAPVLVGVWRISSEPVLAMASLVERYREALVVSWAYRI